MAFTKITAGGQEAYVSFDTDVQIVIPDKGAVKLTSASFVDLLNYFRGITFMVAKKNVNSAYYQGKKPVGYHVESASGELVLVDIFPTRGGEFADVTFGTLDPTTAKKTTELSVPAALLTNIITAANNEGIVATATKYSAIVDVDELPAETAARRGVVYNVAGVLSVLNAAEDGFETVDEPEQFPVLPPTETKFTDPSGATGVELYHLTRPAYDLLTKKEFEPAIYEVKNIDTTAGVVMVAIVDSYDKANKTVRRVDKLPKKADVNALYVLTKEQKDVVFAAGKQDVAENSVLRIDVVTDPENPAWVLVGEIGVDVKITEINDINPYFAVDGKTYIVDGIISKYNGTDKVFTRLGRVVAADELPDVSTTTVDASVIYTLTKADGARARGTRWVFDETTKEFVSFT